MGKIQAVLFDLDDTLIQYERSPAEVLQASFKILERDPLFSVEEYYARFDEFAKKCDSMAELRSECFATLAAESGFERQLGRDLAETFDTERDQTNVELIPSVERILRDLSREYKLGIVTNGAQDAQQQKIDAVDLDRWIDTTVIAGREVPPKPAPEPFERAIQSLGTTATATVHVGDSLNTDIAGATAVGIDSVWVSDGDDAKEYDPTYRIETIGQLLSLPWIEGGPSKDQ